MSGSKKQRGRFNCLTFSLMVACTISSCTEAEEPFLENASGGQGQGEGAHTSSGGAASGGRGAGGPSSGGMGGSSEALGGRGGAAGDSACAVDFVDDFSPGDLPMMTDGGHVIFDAVLDEGHLSCPEGTVPSDRFRCTDVDFCYCEYPCSPECGSSEVCAPADDGNVCSCHPAMEGTPGDCQWAGLFDTEVLDDCDAWRFSISDNGFPAVAEVLDSSLHLVAERGCQHVVAQVVAQRPPAEVFSEGAALVFDYSAQGEPAEAQPEPSTVRFGSTYHSLPPSAEPREFRFCVRLEQHPELVELSFSVENGGLCEDETPAELRVSNLRIESDSDCL